MSAVAMNYPKYESYKDSGVGWLGEIPSDWKLGRISAFFSERRQKVSDKDYPPLSVTKLGVFPQWKNVAKSNDGDNRKLVKKGDFVINSRSDRKGSSGIAKQDGSVSLINIVLKPVDIEPRYSEYLFKSYNFIEEFYRVGHGIVADLWTTRFDDIKNSMIALPSLDVQTKIANFLDEKTAQIDQAIALKQQQIDKLNEYKQIVIQNAVTKGLNPKAPMKNSGVEWIGEIPEHWEVKKLKYIGKIKNGMDYKHVEAESGYPVIGSGGQFTFASKYIYDGEAVLLGRKGTIDKPLYINDKFWTVDTMFYCICKRLYSTKFIYYCAITIPFHYYSTATALPSMTQSDLNNHKFAMPSLSEQIEIIDYLETTIAKFDKVSQKYQTQIDRLKEYKNILINQAVTGKIKID